MTVTTRPESTTPVVYVIDDDASVRAGLEDLLASVGLGVRTFESVAAFLDAPRSNAPGCLVLDVRMPGRSGLEFHRSLDDLGITLPVIFITGHGDVAMAVGAMKAGAADFLTKPFRDQDLLDAIQTALDKDAARQSRSACTLDLRRRYETLTEGERQVFRLVVRGLLNKQIAADLGVSEVTVKVRRAAVMRKMDAGSLPDLVRMADTLAAG